MPSPIGRLKSATMRIPKSAAANSARLSALRQVGGWSKRSARFWRACSRASARFAGFFAGVERFR